MTAVHTIWVPHGWSVEQTWEHVKRGEKVRPACTCGAWVNVDGNGKRL